MLFEVYISIVCKQSQKARYCWSVSQNLLHKSSITLEDAKLTWMERPVLSCHGPASVVCLSIYPFIPHHIL